MMGPSLFTVRDFLHDGVALLVRRDTLGSLVGNSLEEFRFPLNVLPLNPLAPFEIPVTAFL